MVLNVGQVEVDTESFGGRDSQLLLDVLYAVALHGRDGVVLEALWPLCPRIGDAETRTFVWREMCQHPQLQFARGHMSRLETGQRVTASEPLRAWIRGIRDCDDGGLPIIQTLELAKILDEALQGVAKGVAQNEFTKSVGPPRARRPCGRPNDC